MNTTTATTQGSVTFISAGAGSGKTHRLTEILHRELNGKQVRPSGVIATTFTRKAATELRERVRGHLLSQGDFAMANAIGQARIGTVNSVCGQLLERFAFEAGMATQQQVLEEVQSKTMLRKAIDSVLDGPAMASLLILARRLSLVSDNRKGFGASEDWREHLKSLVDQLRANDIDPARIRGFAAANAKDLLAHFPAPTTQDLSALLRQHIHHALPEIEKVAASGNKKNTNEYLASLRGFVRGLEDSSTAWSEWAKLSKSFPEASLKPLAEPIAEMAARVSEHPALHRDIAHYLEQMFDLAARALDVYALNKREQGVLDFADQEHLLLKLLDHPTVAEVMSEELDLLMVDEFQDTSPIQLALFFKLARFAKSVYWVGDIKQAIYGFRGSDTELMQSILKALPQMGGTKEVLPASWRSRGELVNVVNAVFGNAFSNSLPKEEVVLTSTRKDQLPGAPLANWILGGSNIKEEMSALAAGVRRLVESKYQVIDKGSIASRNVRYGDIAILSRFHTGVQATAFALKEQGIAAATSQPGLLQTPEATLALACLRRLNDPGDTIATAEVLSLADSLDPQVWVADRLRYLAEKGKPDEWMEVDMAEHKAHPLVAKLADLRQALPLMAPKEALQTVIASCDLPSKVVGWSKDPDLTRVRLANLEALLDLAAQYEDLCRSGQHAASISGLIRWLAEVANDAKDMLAEPAINAVKVMTHHAAKGLEWPVVILCDLSASIKDRLWSITAQSAASFDAQRPLKDRSIRFWPWPFGAQKKVSVADTIALTPAAKSFKIAAVEENKRLLYVSMTRARDLLILARSSRNPKGEWLDCVDAPWLLPEEGLDSITLPSGNAVQADHWVLDQVAEPGEASESEASTLYWFTEADLVDQRLPLNFNPSRAEKVSSSVLEKVQVGTRIPVSNGTDMAILGTAFHACLAMSFTDPKTLLSIAEVEKMLSAFNVSGSVSAASVLQQVNAFHQWIADRWGKVTAYAEYPVQSVLENRQVMNGRIDLLLETAGGWVLIDHKSNQLAPDHWDQLANEYGAQLNAYVRAIEEACEKSVAEIWLFLPVAGGAVRLESPIW